MINDLVVWNMTFMTFHILGIIPTGVHIFQRCWNHQPNDDDDDDDDDDDHWYTMDH